MVSVNWKTAPFRPVWSDQNWAWEQKGDAGKSRKCCWTAQRSMVKNDEIAQNANKSLTKKFWNAIFEQLWKWSIWPPYCPPNDAPTCESPRKTLTNGMESWGIIWWGPHEGRLAQSQKCDFQKMRITRRTEHLQQNQHMYKNPHDVLFPMVSLSTS